MTNELASRVELLLAKPYPTKKDVEAHCSKARVQNFRSVTVPSSVVELAYDLVADEGLKVSCLVGYPFGQSDPDVKRYEVEAAIDFGAHEIELVPSIAPPLGRELSVADVKKLRALAGDAFGLKVGGFKQDADISSFIDAGANRIGLLA